MTTIVDVISGPQGPPGPSGGVTTIVPQSTPAAVWSIAHNLGRFPSVTVVNSAGDEVEGDVQFLDGNHLTITFAAAFAGVCYLN